MKLYGKIPVLERLKTSPKTIKKIYLQEGNAEGSYIRKKAKKWGIPVYTVPRTKMAKLGRSLNTQGVLVEIEGFEYAPYADLLENAVQKRHTLLFMDGLNDPQNLGGIIRSIACLGQFSVVVPSHGSVGVTETVLRVAAGGDNYVQVAQVSNLNQAIKKAKDAGFWIAGTVVQNGQDINDVKFNFPLALIIGSEQKGIREVTRKHLDIEVSIPMAQSRLSMNVAHATSILCYEITRQKK